ncbi:hypothetical protein CRT60_07515 [Azospirillum palustre]|uniref:Uncharacterized protein n=1 Tax=Azospirillum palustre TaxID=2044885 RepID=A0A2B8BJB5_9PROT|nr:hypothetical protein [Azospirillum palustre]PGH57819.1 hypothetical protein CRT60_07515 [Azospirillum palustre]
MAHTPYDQQWDKAKKEFEALTGKHKPKESKGIFNAFGSHTGLSGSLKKCEKALTACDTVNSTDVKEGKKVVAAFLAASKDFSKAKKGYLEVLQKEIYAEFDKRTEKDFKTNYEKALKFLVKELAALEATIESAVGMYTQKFNEAEKDLSVEQKMLKNWEKNINGALARAAAGVAKVKAKPTAETYNELFPTLARDITMQLVFARKIEGLLADPDFFKKKLDPWANQSNANEPVKVPADATPKVILDHMKEFSAACKGVVQLVNSRTSA